MSNIKWVEIIREAHAKVVAQGHYCYTEKDGCVYTDGDDHCIIGWMLTPELWDDIEACEMNYDCSVADLFKFDTAASQHIQSLFGLDNLVTLLSCVQKAHDLMNGASFVELSDFDAFLKYVIKTYIAKISFKSYNRVYLFDDAIVTVYNNIVMENLMLIDNGRHYEDMIRENLDSLGGVVIDYA